MLNVGTQDPNEEAANEVLSLSVPGIQHLLGVISARECTDGLCYLSPRYEICNKGAFLFLFLI